MIRRNKKILFSCIAVIIITVLTLGGIAMVEMFNGFGGMLLSSPDDYTKFNNTTAVENQTVFLGDSITEMYDIYNFYSEYIHETGQMIYNRGISGNTTRDILDRLDDNVLNIRPKNVVLLVGTNDLSKTDDTAGIAENIEEIIIRCKDNGAENIILLAVYPVNRYKNFFGYFMVGKRDNDDINELNVKLKEIAKAQNITFLDITDSLKDSKGRLKKEYTYDGLHINDKAYGIVTENIMPLLIS